MSFFFFFFNQNIHIRITVNSQPSGLILHAAFMFKLPHYYLTTFSCIVVLLRFGMYYKSSNANLDPKTWCQHHFHVTNSTLNFLGLNLCPNNAKNVLKPVIIQSNIIITYLPFAICMHNKINCTKRHQNFIVSQYIRKLYLAQISTNHY